MHYSILAHFDIQRVVDLSLCLKIDDSQRHYFALNLSPHGIMIIIKLTRPFCLFC